MKNCLIYTVKNDQRHLNNLVQSLTLFRDNLNKFVNNIDIIFFYDNGAEGFIENLVKQLNLTNKIILKEFTTKMPVYPDILQKEINETIANPNILFAQNVGYKNMCRFWAGEIFKDEIVKTYDYYLRLDTDAYITSPVGYNIFDEIDKENKICTYIKGNLMCDPPQFCQKLNKTLVEYESKYNGQLMKSASTLLPEGMYYNTNFEICKVKSFIESDYLKFYDHIDQSGGIYLYRWGDHIIRYAISNILFDNFYVKEVDNIKYTHQGFINGKLYW